MYRIVQEENGVGRMTYSVYFGDIPTRHKGYRFHEGAMRLVKLLIGMN